MRVPERYRQWVDYHYPTKESAQCQCAEATLLMVKAYPELKRVCGFLHHPFTGEPLQHWWCVTEYGDIVDPTYRQFDIKGPIDPDFYERLDPPPTGRCLECGELVFNQEGSTQFCNSFCSSAFHRSLTT